MTGPDDRDPFDPDNWTTADEQAAHLTGLFPSNTAPGPRRDDAGRFAPGDDA